VEVWERQERKREEREGKEEVGGFHGVGRALGGSKAVSGGGKGSTAATGGGGGGDGGLAAMVFTYIITIAVYLYNRLRSSVLSMPSLLLGGGSSSTAVGETRRRHTVDSTRPTTFISVRIPVPSASSSSSSSGKKVNRKKVEFNTTHTVGDLRQYCQSELLLLLLNGGAGSKGGSGYGGRTTTVDKFDLLAGFPPKVIETEDLSLEEAGLLNSAVDVRMVVVVAASSSSLE